MYAAMSIASMKSVLSKDDYMIWEVFQMNFDRTMKLGDLVALHPATAEVLKSYRIDFCCGGNRPLQEVIAESGLDKQEVANKLEEAINQTKDGVDSFDWTKASLSTLIDHIVRTHHAYLYRTLPELAQYVLTIDNVHGSGHPELSKLRKLYTEMQKELLMHLPKEEMELFPAIKKLEQEPAFACGQCREWIGSLEDEHENCGDILKEIREITRDYTLPEDACATYQFTFQKLQELESDLFQHIHLENNILFPLAKSMK
jgi:regulator of cell morphogenesis and NO signaling